MNEMISKYEAKIEGLKKQIETMNLSTFDVIQDILIIKIYRNRIRCNGGKVNSLCHAIKNK